MEGPEIVIVFVRGYKVKQQSKQLCIKLDHLYYKFVVKVQPV